MIETNIERLWEQLLAFIEEGLVIPVIGPELLILQIEGKSTLLYTYLAEQLARRMQISFEPDDSLNLVVCKYLSQGGGREDIYPALKRALSELSPDKLPDTLIKLAEIRPLNLFVSTSFDPYLAQVLNQLRFGGENKTRVLGFNLKSYNDLPAVKVLKKTTVFHLFGKVSATPEYAVTDEDVLEFMHELLSHDACPKRLSDALVNRYLMVIGCPLSDWLGRFFVRIGNKNRLVISGDKIDFLIGDQLHKETNLLEFLQYFCRKTKVFPMTSIEFINQLHQRWMALHPSKDEPYEEDEEMPIGGEEDVVVPLPENEDLMQKGAVFLSYAHEDQSTVEIIKDAFEIFGIEVWLDRNPHALRVGDKFETRIKTNIEQCSLFVPIISRNTLTQEPRYFHKEWKYAEYRADFYPDNRRFLIPVAIDDTPPEHPDVNEKFRNLHWERIENGQCSTEFLSEIKSLQRRYRKVNR